MAPLPNCRFSNIPGISLIDPNFPAGEGQAFGGVAMGGSAV